MSDNPHIPGIYTCVVAEENGERAECCMWDGTQWLWWSTFFDPPEWDPVTHCNCRVIGWTEPVLWNVDQPTSALRASTAAAGDVLAERKRQREKEGWTEAHDDEHEIGEMSQAAACNAARKNPVGPIVAITLPLPVKGKK